MDHQALQMTITFVCWKWRGRNPTVVYKAEYVNAMTSMLERRCSLPKRVVCVTDDVGGVKCETHPLWGDYEHIKNVSGQHLPSCYRRLKIFDPATQRAMGIKEGTRVVSIDLDAVLTNAIDSLFLRPERFVGWHVPGTRHETVYNGSMFMFTAGDLEHVWREFNPVKSPAASLVAGYMGSDQGYLSHKLVKEPWASGWTAGRDGVLSFVRDVGKKKVRPMTGRIVFFAGRRKPWHDDVLKEHPWIHDCVREAAVA